MSTKWLPAQALPAYFGGKASAIGDIFKAISTALPRSAWSRCTFADAFLGGGSVSLAAKRFGFRVLGNDLADRAIVVGKALIANDRVTLTEADMLRLHAPHPDNDRFIEQHLVPDFFLPAHAAWLDNAFAVARSVEDETKRNLLLLVLMHAILRVRPFADFARKEVTQKFAEGDFEEKWLNIGGIKRLLSLTPSRLVDGLRERINHGVFSNGHRHEVHQQDVLDFVAQAEGDVLYMDFPYWGSNPYEKVYRGLDMIIEHRSEPREVSGFNLPGADQLMEEVFDRSRHFPLWVVSYGGPKLNHEDCRRMVARFRQAEIAPIKIRYRFGTPGKDSGKQREILVLGRA